MEAPKNDVMLRSMINNKMIVLQKYDPDRNNKLCDIEDEDEIENKSEIKVLLRPDPGKDGPKEGA